MQPLLTISNTEPLKSYQGEIPKGNVEGFYEIEYFPEISSRVNIEIVRKILIQLIDCRRKVGRISKVIHKAFKAIGILEI